MGSFVFYGELGYESLRGSDSYSFRFADSWIKKYNAITLSEDINNYPGIQYTQPNKDIFGCFADALPDRWGRTLLPRREQILAQEEIEKSEEANALPEKRWIAQLVQPGSSLGGARPKANRLGITKREIGVFEGVFDSRMIL